MELEIIFTPSAGTPRSHPILFLHGAFHGAWCWQEHFMPFFSAASYDCYALSFRGHGSSEGRDRLDQFGLDDYVEDVIATIARLAIRPMLVGHSMGGGVAQRVMARFPDRIAGVVLLGALPPGYQTVGETLRLLLAPRSLLAFLRLAYRGAVTRDEAYQLPFYSRRLPRSLTDLYQTRLQPESARARTEMMKFRPPRIKPAVPLMVVGSRNDQVFGAASTRRLARHYDTEPILLDTLCHNMMQDPDWRICAERVLEWLGRVPARRDENQQRLF